MGIAARFRENAGFGLIDIGIGLMVATLIATMALVAVNKTVPGMKTNKAMFQTMAQLRSAREMAITQRRQFVVQFVGNNQIKLSRIEEPHHNETVVNTLTLQDNCLFFNFGNIPNDTPDGFGKRADVDFGGPLRLIFLSDGTLVDPASGDPISGTVFLGLAQHSEVARAVTVLGATGRIRAYRWTGNTWIQ